MFKKINVVGPFFEEEQTMIINFNKVLAVGSIEPFRFKKQLSAKVKSQITMPDGVLLSNENPEELKDLLPGFFKVTARSIDGVLNDNYVNSNRVLRLAQEEDVWRLEFDDGQTSWRCVAIDEAALELVDISNAENV